MNDMLTSVKSLMTQICQIDKLYEAYMVGGCVRDFIMGTEAHDIDVTTNCPISVLKQHFECHDIGQSQKFGITLISFNGFQFEVANFRKDQGTSDGRHPDKIEIAKTLQEDVMRRDFTINAIGMSNDGTIYDYVNGKKDIADHIIRFVGDPRARVQEDFLRMLRALRFAARFNFTIEVDSMKAIREHAFCIQSIAKERIKQEIFKTASYGGKALAKFILLADEAKILNFIFPEISAMKDDVHQPKHHPEGALVNLNDGSTISLVEYENKIKQNVSDPTQHNISLVKYGTVFDHTIAALNSSDSKDSMVNIAILLHDIGKPFEKRFHETKGYDIYHSHDQKGPEVIGYIGKRLGFSSLEIEALSFSTENHMIFYDIPDMRLSKVQMILESPYFELLKSTCLGDTLATARKSDLDHFNEVVAKFETLKSKIQLKKDENTVSPLRKLINGELVMKLTGLKPGKEVGRIINETFEWATDNEVSSTEEIEKHIIEVVNGNVHQS